MNFEEYLKRICVGVAWGKPLVNRWTDDKRLGIFTVPGHTAWVGVGSRAYYPSEHYLVDLEIAAKSKVEGFALLMNTRIKRHEGRLTKSMFEEWKNYTNERS